MDRGMEVSALSGMVPESSDLILLVVGTMEDSVGRK